MAVAAMVVLSGCSILTPVVVDCQLEARCAEVVTVASRVLPPGAERITVNVGRARFEAFHAEVHACYRDGGYVLVDVVSTGQRPLGASIRTDPWLNPPCR